MVSAHDDIGGSVLPPRQLDRAAGVLLGAACGDALGVPYEFAAPPGPGQEPVMAGGGLGPYEPGEYSDDTQMAVCIAQVAATGADLRSDQALDDIAAHFLDWGPPEPQISARKPAPCCTRRGTPPASRHRRSATLPGACTSRLAAPPGTDH